LLSVADDEALEGALLEGLTSSALYPMPLYVSG
jgi:hypothetical protein